MLHPEPVRDPGMPRVEHDAGLTTGREHADRLGDRLARVRRVVQHAPGVDAVERGVVERQRLGVGRSDVCFQPLERESAAHELDGMLRQVDAGRDRAGPDETDEVRSEPDPDLEQALAAGALEIGEPVDVRVELVSRTLDLGEELRRPLGVRRVFRPAGLLLPEVLDPRLLIDCRRRRGHRQGTLLVVLAPAAGAPRHACRPARAAR